MRDEVVCELCGRAHETADMDAALVDGWRLCLDGWLCPKCIAVIVEASDA